MTGTLFIEGGRLVDGTGAPPVAANVLLEDGAVVAVGAEADARANHARRADRLDARGLTVMPGLIDAHCHLAFDDAQSNAEIFFHRRNALSALVAAHNARKLLRAGVTGILDPDSTFENMIDLRDAIEAGIVEGPRMSCGAYALITAVGGTAGRLIADEGRTGYYMAVSGKDEIVHEIRRQIKHGADWIKVHVTGIIPRLAHKGEMCVWTEDELKLICDTAHELDTPVMGHCRGAKATARAARAGFDLIFHATGMDEAALEALVDAKVPVAPALTFQANLVDFGAKIGTDPALLRIFENEIRDSADTLSRAYRAGVPLIAGSEAGFSMVPYGEWHYREMEVFVRYFGLTPLEAINAATEAGAFALKMTGKVGAVKPGYRADLILVEGDPSEDVTILGETDRIRHVMIDGAMKDLSPPPPRKPIPGWTVASIGRERLTRELAFSNQPPPQRYVHIDELH